MVRGAVMIARFLFWRPCRAGFVMANSASDARASEQEIRQKLIESRAVDGLLWPLPKRRNPGTCPLSESQQDE